MSPSRPWTHDGRDGSAGGIKGDKRAAHRRCDQGAVYCCSDRPRGRCGRDFTHRDRVAHQLRETVMVEAEREGGTSVGRPGRSGMTAVSPPTTVDSGSRPAQRRRPSNISAVAWTPKADIGYRDWIVEGRRIGAMGRASPWWVGDWLVYGEARWGERYTEAARITGYDKKTLRNLRYVASRFDLSLRRDNPTWTHHMLLAALEPDEQKYWLDRALADGLSVDDLRIELRSAGRGHYSTASRQDELPDVSGEAALVICPKCDHEFRPMQHP